MGRRRGRSPGNKGTEVGEQQSTLLVCSRQGCQFSTTKSEELDSHAERCRYRTIQCQNCGEDVLINDIYGHLTKTCRGQMETCPFCHTEVGEFDLYTHKAGCAKNGERDRDDGLVECFMKEMGCTFRADRGRMKAHEKDYKLHFPMMVKFMNYQEECSKELSERLNQFEKKMNSMDERLKSRLTKLSSAVKMPDELAREVSRRTRPTAPKADETAGNSHGVSLNISEMKQFYKKKGILSSDFERYLNTLDCIQEEFDSIKEKIDHIKHMTGLDLRSDKSTDAPNITKEGLEFKWLIEKFSKKTDKVCLEGPNYDVGHNQVTCKPGLFLNNGNDHIDVGLWVHQRYDDINKDVWPRSLQVELSKPDESFTAQVNASDGFSVLDENSGFFYIEKFISYKELEEKKFIENDTINVKFIVL